MSPQPVSGFWATFFEAPGRKSSAVSIGLAALSLLILPVVFGPLGVFFGALAVARRGALGGVVGITASASFAMTSYLLTVNLPA
ncbi:MAG: hypothetical protein BZY88_10265 [SAR202 cluster bacterium Io17-Chloro-G9]|nr:MAG: hypothetical protein BZY88_10265 [SAR202 cluster bacterium Io17-Chloro-G9]